MIEAYAPNAPRTCATVGPALRSGETRHIACNHDTKGSKVRIRLLGRKPRQKLAISELEVYAVQGKNILIRIKRIPFTRICIRGVLYCSVV